MSDSCSSSQGPPLWPYNDAPPVTRGTLFLCLGTSHLDPGVQVCTPYNPPPHQSSYFSAAQDLPFHLRTSAHDGLSAGDLERGFLKLPENFCASRPGYGLVVENLPSMGLISSPHPHTKIVPVVVVVLFLRFMNTMISGVCNALSHVS